MYCLLLSIAPNIESYIYFRFPTSKVFSILISQYSQSLREKFHHKRNKDITSINLFSTEKIYKYFLLKTIIQAHILFKT